MKGGVPSAVRPFFTDYLSRAISTIKIVRPSSMGAAHRYAVDAFMRLDKRLECRMMVSRSRAGLGSGLVERWVMTE